MRKYLPDLVCLALICLTLPLFFYKLGQTSLTSWDEAWYGVIAKHMLSSGDFLHMVFNNLHFTDHPPGGIWPIALAYKILGVSEFATRLPSAIAGFASLIITYLLGKKLFNRVVGFASAMALCSAPWFLLRGRLGDLDAPLLLAFLLTVYLALVSTKNTKMFLFFALALGYLTTIKAALPFAVIPCLLVIFWGTSIWRIKYLFLTATSIVVFYGLWLLGIRQIDMSSYRWHLSHLSRGGSLVNSDYLANLKKFKMFLHSGVGKWFWPGIGGLVGGVVLRQKRFIILAAFVMSYSLPFLTSTNIEIWHLIPLYPFMLIAAFGFGWVVAEKFLPRHQGVIAILALGVCFYFSLPQIKRFWQQNIDINAYISDEAVLSRASTKVPYPLTIDYNFLPAAYFYSDKKLITQYSAPNLDEFFANKDSRLMITYQWRLDASKADPVSYEILAHDRDKVLLLKRVN